jgi:SAM-dependent methyltransferase
MWDKRYSDAGYAYGTAPNDFLRDQASDLPVGDALCLGEGEGRNAVFLAGLGHHVWALDGSAVGLEKAQKLATEKGVGVNVIHADLAGYDLEPDRWDCIVSIFCHLLPDLRRKVHGQIAKALRPGGRFILEAYTPDQLRYGTGGPRDAAMMMDAASLRDELDGLKVEILREGVREIREGQFHDGIGATVQLVART